MKLKIKKSNLLMLSLLSASFIIWVVSVANWLEIKTNLEWRDQHVGRLYSLFLWTGDENNSAWIKVLPSNKNVNILNWLIVSPGSSKGTLIVVWWWEGNNILDSNNSWIGWWSGNRILSWDSSAIWWWIQNTVRWGNAVVMWGFKNVAQNSGIVAGWFSWTALNGGVVLGWFQNEANWQWSLVLWRNAKGKEWSFSWNANNSQNESARIDATSGVLIWTFTPINGVSLVVSGAVKIGTTWDNRVKWRIGVNSDGCILAYNGSVERVIGKVSESKCWFATWCQFWNTILQNGESVTGYSVPYATNCKQSTIEKRVTCNWTSLTPAGYTYPYCYKIDASPVNKH